MNFKEKILSKSNSYLYYKDFYEKHQNQEKNVVTWEDIFTRIAKNDAMSKVTMETIQDNFKNGKNIMKYCPVCNHQTPIFIAGGVKFRINAMCPNCDSLERHRFLAYFIKNKFNLEDDLKLLHFAPEKSFYNIFNNLENIEYYTGDIKKSAYVKEIIDIQDIPYDDDFFNLIICNHVLEHVPDDNKAMEELHRIVKPASQNGGAIIMVPLDFNRSETLEKEEYNTPELREKYYGQHDHLRYYGMDFQEKLESVGFNVEVYDYNSPFVKNPKKYGFNKGDVIFYCTK
jgi:SAM-dependent methyltransferase